MREYIIAFECPATDSFERIAYKVQQKFVGELIRCKDCKHFREPNDAKRTPYCWYFAEDVNPEEDYCSWAERRKGNPSEFDAVPVIRCKDCYAYEHQKGDSFGVCKVWMNNTREDGYCHEGEKDENV